MSLNSYVDIILDGASGEISYPVIANQVLSVLHGAFKALDKVFALSLPNCLPGKKTSIGNRLRVFSTSEESLKTLLAAIEDHFIVRDYCAFKKIQGVPEDFNGPWVEYRRFRPSNKNADRNNGDESISLRERRMQDARERRLPYFILRSQSNLQGFSLIVEPRKFAQDQSVEVAPDKYGLSVSSRSFGVPQIP